ncbi:MAG: 3-methylornithine--L-lysine ligase PylC [Desulfotomaculaceae bacterium]|nr:3-methylornithine--L-lysine ligase PylC [Desulfotomaculaceae bacterium]
MLVAVMGGKLQGVEAVYLAQKAGWQVVLVDRDPDAPAAGMCDNFLQCDFMEKDKLMGLFKEVQFVVLALENSLALENINQCALAAGVKIFYDPAAYTLSSSKIMSDRLFADLGIPVPKPWPHCGFPVTFKPSEASGSESVYRINSLHEFNELIKKLGNSGDWVKQEYLQGPSYSIEVVGYKGDYRAFQVTELEMDARYDCKRVLAPAELSLEKVHEFKESALKIARALNLNGIMDVEVILHEDKLKVLEIDARLPSQTPTVVYQSTGVNLLEALWSDCTAKSVEAGKPRGVVYEHIKVTGKRIEVGGEHMMSEAGRLCIYKDFFGAEEAISNFNADKEEWVATLIITGKDRNEAWHKRCTVIRNIMEQYGINDCIDLYPH